MNGRTFTGRHMTMILVAFFGVVIAVNMVMATLATRTFGGLVVENSYVASQKFNGWFEKAREEKALGWTLAAQRLPDGRVAIRLSGAAPIANALVTALARHPLGRMAERGLAFRPGGDRSYESTAPLPAGRWILHVEAQAEGRTIHRVVDLQ
ncbi:MAG: FixH family protein [Sphingobium sp.]|nr:FixH family protein [Sphingobium sp.]